jgi:hypothetical protein
MSKKWGKCAWNKEMICCFCSSSLTMTIAVSAPPPEIMGVDFLNEYSPETPFVFLKY